MGGDLREGELSFFWKVSCFLSCCAGLGTQGVWRGASSGRQAYGGGECSGQPWGLGPQGQERGRLVAGPAPRRSRLPTSVSLTCKVGSFPMHPLLVSLGVSLLLASVYGSKGCVVLCGGCFSSGLRCWENSVTPPPPPEAARVRACVRVHTGGGVLDTQRGLKPNLSFAWGILTLFPQWAFVLSRPQSVSGGTWFPPVYSLLSRS